MLTLREKKYFFSSINVFFKVYFHSSREWVWFNIRKSLLRWVWSRKLPKTFDFWWDSFFLRYQWIIQRENCATKAFRKLLTNCIDSLPEKFFQQDEKLCDGMTFSKMKKTIQPGEYLPRKSLAVYHLNHRIHLRFHQWTKIIKPGDVGHMQSMADVYLSLTYFLSLGE